MTSLFENLALPVPTRPSAVAPVVAGAHTGESSGLPLVMPPRGEDEGAAVVDPGIDRAAADALLVGLNPQQREAVLHRGRSAADRGRRGLGQDARAHAPHRAPARRPARPAPSEILAITFTNKAAAEMRERVAALVGPAARAHVGLDVPLGLRAHPAPRGRHARAALELHDLRLGRLPAAAQRSWRASSTSTRRSSPAKALARKISNAQGRARRPGVVRRDARRGATRNDFDERARRGLHALPAAAAPGARARLRRPHHARRCTCCRPSPPWPSTTGAGSATCSSTSTRTRTTPSTRWSASSRGPSAERGAATPAGARRAAASRRLADRGRRRRPVDLRVPRGRRSATSSSSRRDYPDARTILLEQNYRSTQNILSAANAVIARNPDRTAKQLWTDAGAGAKIVGYVADTEHDEARFVADEIDRLGRRRRRAPRRRGGLLPHQRPVPGARGGAHPRRPARTRWSAARGSTSARRSRTRSPTCARSPTRTTTSTCAASSTCPSAGSATGPRRWSRRYAERERISFGSALDRARRGARAWATRAITGLRAFADLMDGLRELAEPRGPARRGARRRAGPHRLPRRAARERGPAGRLAGGEPRRAARRGHRVRAVRARGRPGATSSSVSRSSPTPTRSPRPTVPRVTSPVPRSDQGVVTLMTLHTAKGLEFPVVFVTGMEDGTFPHMRSLADTDQLAEERRLAYVGLTRARERLYISRAAVRTAWGVPNEFPAEPVPRRPARGPHRLAPSRESSTSQLRGGWGSGFGSGGGGFRASGSGGSGSGARTSGSASTQAARRAAQRPALDRREVRLRDTAPRGGRAALAIGDRVTHDSYGLGTVVALEGAGSNAVAKVDFGSDGHQASPAALLAGHQALTPRDGRASAGRR